MIFVIVGSQKFPFNRLLQSVDEAIEHGVIQETVFAQAGSCTYQPRYFAFKSFINQEEFDRKIAEASLVITHAGAGAIVGALKKKKKVIAMARLSELGEHVDDHQLQILEEFEKQGLICACRAEDSLEEKYREVLGNNYQEYRSNTFRWICDLNEYITQLK